MRFCVVMSCLILVAIACLPGYSVLPSFRGPTGLIIIPTADALGRGDWNAGVFVEDIDDATLNDIVANYGLAQGLEIGINHFREDEDADAGTWLNAKYRFIPETPTRPAVAVGVIDITDDSETTAYVVASMSFACLLRAWEGQFTNVRIHGGLGAGRLDGLFIGASGTIANRLELMAEWDSEFINAGARYRITPEFTIHAAAFNLADDDDTDVPANDGITFGVGASFNMTY